jgi:hypothetical protein
MSSEGMTRLGVACEFERRALENQSISRALEWYRAGAAAGNPESQRHLGFCLQHGLGCEHDLSRSVEWYKLYVSRQQGEVETRLLLASSLQFGVGCDVDLGEAADYYAPTRQQSVETCVTHSYRCRWALGQADAPQISSIARDLKRPPAQTSSRFHPHAASSDIWSYLDASRIIQSGGFVGLGDSSTVSSEKNHGTGEVTAVKRFFPDSFNQTKFMREVELLVQLNHPCVLRIHGWKLPIQDQPAEIRTALAVNGSLKDIMKKIGSGTHFSFWNPTELRLH